MTAPRFLLLGNPENRRVTGFAAALRERGEPEPIVLSHRELLSEPERLLQIPDLPLLVRMDATGEDEAAERLLLERGYDDARESGCTTIDPDELRARGGVRFGEILAPRQHQLGFRRYLDQLATIFAKRPSWRILQSPRSVAELFDKRVTSRRYAGLGIPVPEFLDGISTPEQLREQLAKRRWPAVFVKLACGSSASCVALYQQAGPRERILTTVHSRTDGRFNSLRLQQLTERAAIDDLLAFLLEEGSQVERAIAKARLGSRAEAVERMIDYARRQAADGEPLTPSRLLLAGEQHLLPARVLRLCDPAHALRRNLPYGAPPAGSGRRRGWSIVWGSR
jgi:hypothetical protein